MMMMEVVLETSIQYRQWTRLIAREDVIQTMAMLAVCVCFYWIIICTFYKAD